MSDGLGEMSRYEVKFVAMATEMPRLCRWIRLHKEGFLMSFPDRTVNNAYFDSNDYDAYGDSLSGASIRRKLRYRWYGESRVPDCGVLEVKLRRSQFGSKYLYPVATSPITDGPNWRSILTSIRRQVPLAARLLLDYHSFPVLINRYTRQYFISTDGSLRITVDTGLSIYDQRYKSLPNTTRKATTPDVLILECKADQDLHDRISDAIANLPIRVSRFSKYGTGVTALTDH